jgi:hypothetical protein
VPGCRVVFARERWRGKLVRAVQDGVAGVRVDLARAEERAEQRHAELLEAMRAWERRQRRDVFTALEQEAARSSAELVRDRMPYVALHVHPHDTLRHALAASPEGGLALEFGVASGTTLRIIAAERGDRRVLGFDSFEGLPEHWRLGFDAGAFAVPAPPDVGDAELVVGWFADVLPGFLAEHAGPVTFLHVDCDLYSSTRTVLEHVGPRLVEGSVVLFDEYYNYPGWQRHEHRAWTEWTAANDVGWDYLGLTMDDEQVSVRITRPPQP